MRKELLNKSEINDWKIISPKYKVGIKYMGEYRMGSEWCKIIVEKDSEEDINLGDLSFSNISDSLDAYFLIAGDGKYLLLKWMFYKIHAHIVPVLINVIDRTFLLIETEKMLDPKALYLEKDKLIIKLDELFWIGANPQKKEREIAIETELMSPIEEFFTLNEASLLVPVVTWKDGQPQVEIK